MDAVPNPMFLNSQFGEQYEEQLKYVVVRDDIRVSDKVYFDINDSSAKSEMDFWKRVVKNFPDGSKVEIVKYDKKKHRVW